jgi:hypothetical protein
MYYVIEAQLKDQTWEQVDPSCSFETKEKADAFLAKATKTFIAMTGVEPPTSRVAEREGALPQVDELQFHRDAIESASRIIEGVARKLSDLRIHFRARSEDVGPKNLGSLMLSFRDTKFGKEIAGTEFKFDGDIDDSEKAAFLASIGEVPSGVKVGNA